MAGKLGRFAIACVLASFWSSTAAVVKSNPKSRKTTDSKLASIGAIGVTREFPPGEPGFPPGEPGFPPGEPGFPPGFPPGEPPGVVNLGCTSRAAGTTVGRPDLIGGPAGDAQYLFCSDIGGTATIFSCGFGGMTVHIKGPGVDVAIPCNDADLCNCRQPGFDLNVTVGDCYDIYIGGASSEEGTFSIDISCTSATLLCSTLTRDSTVGRPNIIGNPAGDAQYLLCPDFSGMVRISTCGSSFDTWLHVIGPEVSLSCDDCGNCDTRAILEVNVMAGNCYDVYVDGFIRSEGIFNLDIRCFPVTTTTTTAPWECGTAQQVPVNGPRSSDSFDFNFCAPGTGEVTIRTCGSKVTRNETSLSINGARGVVSCNNGLCGPCKRLSEISMNALAGECFRVVVATRPAEIGDYFFVSIACTANTSAILPSVLHSCGDRLAIRGEPVFPFRHLFCPSSSGVAQISTCASNFDTSLQVSGPGVNTACDDCGNCGLQAQATFSFTPGCYEILADRLGDDYPSWFFFVLDMDLQCFPSLARMAPINVTCGSTVTGAAPALATGGNPDGAVLHRFCPSASGAAEISTCDSGGDGWLQVKGAFVEGLWILLINPPFNHI